MRLRLRLLAGGLRRDVWRVVALLVGCLGALFVLAVVVTGLVSLRFAAVDDAAAIVVVAGAVGVLGWTLVPLLAFGVDETLDPANFATFSLARRDMVVGLALGALLGIPGVATVVAVLATVVTWARTPASALVAVAAVPVAVLTCVASCRLASTLAADLLSRRRTREVGGALAVLAMLMVGPAAGLLGNEVTDPLPFLRSAAGVLAWTPLGWVWAAPADVAAGSLVTGLARLVLAVAWLVLLLAAWGVALERALVRTPSSGPVSRRAGEGWVDRLPATPVGAVTARCLRYWRRDPRYATSVLGTLALPLVLAGVALSGMIEARTAMLLVGPVVGGTLGWGQHNDVAYDGTAVWTHVAAPICGEVDRWGRALAMLSWGVPLTVAAAVAGSASAGRLDLLPAVLGASLALLGAGVGVSAVASAVLPYPVPDPGANPFSTPSGAGVATLVGQLVTASATTALAVPTLVAALLAARGWAGAGWVALVLGGCTAAGALLVGVRVGGRLFEARGPELLSALRR